MRRELGFACAGATNRGVKDAELAITGGLGSSGSPRDLCSPLRGRSQFKRRKSAPVRWINKASQFGHFAFARSPKLGRRERITASGTPQPVLVLLPPSWVST
jgi:hypothetical protein